MFTSQSAYNFNFVSQLKVFSMSQAVKSWWK